MDASLRSAWQIELNLSRNEESVVDSLRFVQSSQQPHSLF